MLFPPDHPGSLLFTRKQPSCLAARGPEPPETLSRPPGLRTAHPSRKRSLTAAAFLRKLAAERPSGSGTLIVAAFPPAAADFAHTTAGERCHPGDVSPPPGTRCCPGAASPCRWHGLGARFGCWRCAIPVPCRGLMSSCVWLRAPCPRPVPLEGVDGVGGTKSAPAPSLPIDPRAWVSLLPHLQVGLKTKVFFLLQLFLLLCVMVRGAGD